MRDYGKIAGTFWTRGSGKLLRGDAQAQVVAFYLMTSPTASMTGLYHLAIPTLAHETGITLEGASKALRRVEEAEIAKYDDADELVWVPRMAHWQIGATLSATDNRVKGIIAAIRPFEGHRFYSEFVELYGVVYHLGIEAPSKPLRGPFVAPCKPLQSQEQAQAQAQAQEEEEKGSPPDKPAAPHASTKPGPTGATAKTGTKKPDNRERICRYFADAWARAKGDGAVYPSQGIKDIEAAQSLLTYHRKAKIAERWEDWVPRIFSTYFELSDDNLIRSNNWRLCDLPRKLPALVSLVRDAGPSTQQVATDA